MTGRFIVFEGPDGGGKSTMIEEVRRHLRVRGAEAVIVQDPGGTAIGQQIRRILLDTDNDGMEPLTELLLYVASRAQLVGEIIRPALEAGGLVISDRFVISTLVYQGAARALPEDRLREIVRVGIEDIQPDHVFLLDVPVATTMARLGSKRDRIEQRGAAFFEEVRERYLGYVDALPPERATVIDAARPILAVQKEILEGIDALLD